MIAQTIESDYSKTAWLGGAGKIGQAIIRGVLSKGQILEPKGITVTARHAGADKELAGLGVGFTRDNRQAVSGAGAVFICVHPSQVKPLLDQIAPALAPDAALISFATGVSTAVIESRVGAGRPIIRCVPNTAVLVGQSMTVLCPGRHATPGSMDFATRVFSCVGLVDTMEEGLMDAVTGLAGCGPAFAMRIVEALAQGGIKSGLPRDRSRLYAAQVLKGAAELVLATGRHPAELKDEVSSPGGCTIDGLTKLEERGLGIALIDAVETASNKAGMLCRRNGVAADPPEDA